MAADYESVCCVKNEVLVYRIPPRPSNRGYRAADWNLENPDWTGRLRVVAKGKDLSIKLEDKTTGELFAQCPVEAYPGVAVEAVMDSSRYFVLRIKDESGRSAFIGIGFADRGDSFDLNVALQDHFKWLKQEKEIEKSAKEFDSGPKLDLGFKEGQTITINIGNKTEGKSRPKPKSSGGLGLLPPPPGSKVPPIRPPTATNSFPTSQNTTQQNNTSSSSNQSNVDLLLDLGAPPTQPAAIPQQNSNAFGANVQQNQTDPFGADPWGDFTSAGSATTNTSNPWGQ